MSLSCYCDDGEGSDWYYRPADDFTTLATKRSRKCSSCHTKIKPGETALEFERWRPPSDRCNWIEETIHGDEVPLASFYMCETCGGLFMSVQELGMCCDITENVARQIKDSL